VFLCVTELIGTGVLIIGSLAKMTCARKIAGVLGREPEPFWMTGDSTLSRRDSTSRPRVSTLGIVSHTAMRPERTQELPRFGCGLRRKTSTSSVESLSRTHRLDVPPW
jgi:hypothetical protein